MGGRPLQRTPRERAYARFLASAAAGSRLCEFLGAGAGASSGASGGAGKRAAAAVAATPAAPSACKRSSTAARGWRTPSRGSQSSVLKRTSTATEPARERRGTGAGRGARRARRCFDARRRRQRTPPRPGKRARREGAAVKKRACGRRCGTEKKKEGKGRARGRLLLRRRATSSLFAPATKPTRPRRRSPSERPAMALCIIAGTMARENKLRVREQKLTGRARARGGARRRGRRRRVKTAAGASGHLCTTRSAADNAQDARQSGAASG